MSKRYELPKTKAPFAKYLASLPPRILINPGSIPDCALVRFMKARLPEGTDVVFYAHSYSIGREEINSNKGKRPLPEWAYLFTHEAMRARPDGLEMTVAALKKILEKV